MIISQKITMFKLWQPNTTDHSRKSQLHKIKLTVPNQFLESKSRTSQWSSMQCCQQIEERHQIYCWVNFQVRVIHTLGKGSKCIESNGKKVVKILKSSMIKSNVCSLILSMVRFKHEGKWWLHWRVEGSMMMIRNTAAIQSCLENWTLLLFPPSPEGKKCKAHHARLILNNLCRQKILEKLEGDEALVYKIQLYNCIKHGLISTFTCKREILDIKMNYLLIISYP